jgi:uncharacterized protein
MHQQRRTATIVRKALAVVRPQFRLDATDGIHGLPHWSRVWFHGRTLAAQLDLDPAVLAWFAFLHDSQRHNDGHDPLHGQRAADYAVRLRRDGTVSELDAPGFERLCEAMRLHSDGHTRWHDPGDATVLACWDADRLDLGRVGIRPVPHRLCTAPARQPDAIAQALRLSEGRPRQRRG